MTERKEHKILPPYDLFYEGINLKEVIGEGGLRLLIPRVYIFGRQLPGEYGGMKRRQVVEALNNDGFNYLLENPIITCAVTVGNQLLLTIIDGHHRNRYSGLYPEINLMPCIVNTPEVLVEILNSQRPEGKKIDPGTFIKSLLRDTSEVVGVLSEKKKPQLIPGISNIDELKTRFASF